MGTRKVLGADYYRSLGFSWHTDLLGDQRLGGGIAWSAARSSRLAVRRSLRAHCTSSASMTITSGNSPADRDDDAELAAYNAMLAQLAGRDKPGKGSATGQA
ncbi:hypothetical protein MAHJHV55_51960 [Mycobacterium avium subsp. hominissuis]